MTEPDVPAIARGLIPPGQPRGSEGSCRLDPQIGKVLASVAMYNEF